MALLAFAAVRPAHASALEGLVAGAMILDWLLFVGVIAVLVQIPEVFLFRYVVGLTLRRALESWFVANFASGAAYALTYTDPRPASWLRHSLVGLAIILAVELPILWVMNRGSGRPGRLLVVGAVATVAIYLAALGIAPRFA